MPSTSLLAGGRRASSLLRVSVDDDWLLLDLARTCITAIPALRVERANLVAELVTCGEPISTIAEMLGVNRQRVHQLAASATQMASGSVDVMWGRLEIVHALLEDGNGCYERQRQAMRALVDAGVSRTEVAGRAGVTVGSIAYVLGEVNRKKTPA